MSLREPVNAQHAVMHVRMYDFEYEAFKKAAKKANKSLSFWVREVCKLKASAIGVKVEK